MTHRHGSGWSDDGRRARLLYERGEKTRTVLRDTEKTAQVDSSMDIPITE